MPDNEEVQEETVIETETAEAPIEGAEALGDPGKKALDAMKAERNAERAARRELEAERDALRAQVEGREAEFAAQQERDRIQADALAKANDRIKRSEVRLAAKGKLADPEDALAFIDLSLIEVGENGDVDGAAIEDAIADLISRKPHLAVNQPIGSADQGVGAGNESLRQVTAAELESMTPEQVNQARREGRLANLLGKS